MRALALVGLVGLLAWGCGDGSTRVTGPAGPHSAGEEDVSQRGEVVRAHLRDPFLFAHNARFFGGRTFRWVAPIPIFTITPEPGVNRLVLDQFVAWERILAGAGGQPFYAPQPVPDSLPARGIFFTVRDLPGRTLATGNPFVGFAQAQALLKLAVARAPRPLELPEILPTGEIQRCLITLDPALDQLSTTAIRSIIRHEVGHCLGFIGHVSSGLMKPTCCALNFTSDVVGMMRRLYRLPPGTPVTR